MIWIVAALAAIVTALYVVTGNASAFAGMESVERWALIIGMTLSIVLAGTFVLGSGERLWTSLKHALIWIAIFTGLIGAYAFRDEVSFVGNRIAGELLPPGAAITERASSPDEVAVRIRRRGDGQFFAQTKVNSASVTMLVDTGASTVVLTPADARRAGINVQRLQFTIPVRTANGLTYAAPATIGAVSVGPIIIRDVEALVSKPGNLSVSLLGMTFLRRLRSYGFAGEFLTLRS